jgi:succinate dehydrogenase / fumarate reductase, cytochrome b subunit
MAVTGLLLVGFVIMHFLGNALVFLGPEAINGYSAKLHAVPELLWLARGVLLLAVALHITTAVGLASKNMGARPVGYRVKKDVATSYAARTMVWSGPILAAFLVYHLAHLTLGVAPGTYEHSTTDVYSNVVNGFSMPWLAIMYIVAMVGLGLHLFHGIWSMFQSLGINHSAYNARLKGAALAITLVVTLGNISIPLSVLLGIVR